MIICLSCVGKRWIRTRFIIGVQMSLISFMRVHLSYSKTVRMYSSTEVPVYRVAKIRLLIKSVWLVSCSCVFHLNWIFWNNYLLAYKYIYFCFVSYNWPLFFSCCFCECKSENFIHYLSFFSGKIRKIKHSYYVNFFI